MRKYLLDSNAANLFIYRRCGVYERAIRERKTGAVIGTAIPVVGEVLGGVEYSSSREFNLPIVEVASIHASAAIRSNTRFAFPLRIDASARSTPSRKLLTAFAANIAAAALANTMREAGPVSPFNTLRMIAALSAGPSARISSAVTAANPKSFRVHSSLR